MAFGKENFLGLISDEVYILVWPVFLFGSAITLAIYELNQGCLSRGCHSAHGLGQVFLLDGNL